MLYSLFDVFGPRHESTNGSLPDGFYKSSDGEIRIKERYVNAELDTGSMFGTTLFEPISNRVLYEAPKIIKVENVAAHPSELNRPYLHRLQDVDEQTGFILQQLRSNNVHHGRGSLTPVPSLLQSVAFASHQRINGQKRPVIRVHNYLAAQNIGGQSGALEVHQAVPLELDPRFGLQTNREFRGAFEDLSLVFVGLKRIPGDVSEFFQQMQIDDKGTIDVDIMSNVFAEKLVIREFSDEISNTGHRLAHMNQKDVKAVILSPLKASQGVEETENGLGYNPQRGEFLIAASFLA